MRLVAVPARGAAAAGRGYTTFSSYSYAVQGPLRAGVALGAATSMLGRNGLCLVAFFAGLLLARVPG